MKRTIVVFCMTAFLSPVMAQEVMTLSDCLKIGIENNLSLKVSRNNILKGQHSISENRARLLPQINAVASFNDNFEPPVSVTDGSAYGTKYNVTNTLQYNAAGGLQLQMPLYSQTALTALEISKTLDAINRLSYEKAREDLIMQISKIYYLAQNTAEQIRLTTENIRRLEELRDITVAFFENGMAMEVDVKRVNINLENLTVQRDNAEAILTQQHNMLKYIIDYDADAKIELVKVDVNDIKPVELTGLNASVSELQILAKQKSLAEQQRKLAAQGYLPTLALTGNIMFTAFTDSFKNWFHSGPSNTWYRSNGLGLSLRVPVFDGFEKRSKIRKAQVDIENAVITYDNTFKNMQTQYLNATNELLNSERNYKRQKDNYALAEDVYNVTSDQYREGVASMTDVLQDEMRVSEAQNNYLTAHYNYQVANLSLLKLTCNLNSLIDK